MKNIEQTLAIIKPDGIDNATEIIDMIYKNNLKIEKYQIKVLDKNILEEEYSHISKEPYYNKVIEYMLSGPSVIMVLSGENAVENFRNLMGNVNEVSDTTIRGKYGMDKLHNTIHGSNSKERAEEEIDRFFNQKQKRI